MLGIGPATPSRGPRHPKGASRKPSTGRAWHGHGGEEGRSDVGDFSMCNPVVRCCSPNDFLWEVKNAAAVLFDLYNILDRFGVKLHRSVPLCPHQY